MKKAPMGVDISGGFNYTNIDFVSFLSFAQLNADHYSRTRSYLNPLIENIYCNGSRLIQDFSVNEVLFGRVVPKRGNLDLREAHIFPERFSKGPYNLEVKLETPTKTVESFMGLSELLAAFQKDPKGTILDSDKVSYATKKAVELRERLGTLSRYSAGNSTFSAETNSCVLVKDNSILFYVFNPDNSKNVLVHFGKTEFDENNLPYDLTILSGNRRENTLAKLVDLDFFVPSEAVLEQRINDMQAVYENAARSADTPLNGNCSDILKTLDRLRTVKAYFRDIVNSGKRKEFVMSQPSELLEFMVCPANDDPVLHELFPRMSWNKSLRRYQNTHKFIQQFLGLEEAGKKKMLTQVVSSVLFNNQQNNDTNVWLYQNYRQLCEDNGISFKTEK